jgi:ribosomal protein L11 methyltransferase
MRWLAIRVSGTTAAEREPVIAALIAAGGGAVQEDGEALLSHLPEGADLAAVRAAVAAAGPVATLAIEPLGEVDGQRVWRAQIGVHRVGRLTTAPPWLAGEAGDPAMAVVVEPAMAFGTGEHPTTRGVLRLMQDVIAPGDSVADLGAGSGILAIAAAKLGAARVFAIELDPDAIENAEENVVRNGTADRIRVLEGDASVLLPLVAPVRVVLANIISSALLAMSATIRAALAPGGRAILSGMLLSEREDMVRALSARAWRVEAEDSEGEWWSVTIAPR